VWTDSAVYICDSVSRTVTCGQTVQWTSVTVEVEMSRVDRQCSGHLLQLMSKCHVWTDSAVDICDCGSRTVTCRQTVQWTSVTVAVEMSRVDRQCNGHCDSGSRNVTCGQTVQWTSVTVAVELSRVDRQCSGHL
jgi:hypothetical protein